MQGGYPKALKHVQQNILPKRIKAVEEGEGGSKEKRSHHKQFLERWWQLSYRRTDLLNAIDGLSRYLACSRVTSKPILFFIDASVRPGDALQVFAFADDYSFGVLQASPHIEWFMNKRSNMKSDPRYSSLAVFGTYPWPQQPATKRVDAVVEASRNLQAVRTEALKTAKGGLRALYDTLALPGKNPLRDAHAALDAVVLEAYAFSSKKDLLQQLLDLNLQVALDIKAGKSVTSPGVPVGYPNPTELISDDCLGGGVK